MIEPRAFMWPKEGKHKSSYYDADSHDAKSLIAQGVKLTPLTTVADVLAALRQPSEAMIAAGWIDKDDVTPDEIFLAMLDAFEKDQSSPAKKAYEAANPLGGPARMFDAIAERIRSGEEYYAVLADYGVTVEWK